MVNNSHGEYQIRFVKTPRKFIIPYSRFVHSQSNSTNEDISAFEDISSDEDRARLTDRRLCNNRFMWCMFPQN